MATYGVDYYGASYYGGSTPASYDEDTFQADARAYNAVRLHWIAPPINTWDYVRVTRSRAGFPTNVFEGDEVFYALSGGPSARIPSDVPVDPTWALRQNVISMTDEIEFLDTGLAGGWYYYSLFLHDTGRNRWERVSTTSTLVPFDYNSVDRVWSLIPEFYRTIEDSTAGYSQVLGQINPSIYLTRDRIADNLTLSKWVSIFGWGMDILRSQSDSILDGSDPSRMHMNRLSLLAEQFGSPLETAVSPHHNRSLVRNMSLLYRQRGTLAGLEDQLRLATGWDIEISLGPNMMLNLDQAEFRSPIPPEWDTTRLYSIGETVQRAGVYYQATQSTLGNQPPNATYWTTAPFTESNAIRTAGYLSKYGDVSTWRRYFPSSYPHVGKTWIGMGVPDPANPALETNALETHLDGSYDWTGVTRMQLMSMPTADGDSTGYTYAEGRQNVIESAIPVPVALPWDSTRVYEAGDLVLYLGVPYEANTRTQAVPDGSSQWRQMGFDARSLMGMSLFVHGPFSGVAGGGINAKPVVAFFDTYGNELLGNRYVLDTTAFSGIVYDSFVGPQPLDLPANGGRTTSIGNTAWSVNTGPQWKTGRASDGGYAYPSGSALSYATFQYAQTNAWVAVTLRSIPSAPREIGLIVRRSDANNYWAVTNLGIYKVVSGVKSTVQTWTAGTFVNGDRIRVRFHSGGIQVYRNRVGAVELPLYLGTDTFNALTTNTHGVIAW